jgi:hypothetical protein
MANRKQRTFTVGGEKIRIVSNTRNHCQNPCGFWVTINGERFMSNQLERDRAEDECFVKWMKRNH